MTTESQDFIIRPAGESDRDSIWAILEPTFRAGETYALPRDISEAEGLQYWLAPEHHVFVLESGESLLGTYYLRANQAGGGAHVANCGYVVAASAQGKGIATAMCRHSLVEAKERNFRAMQFNLVVGSNERAVSLWERLGFEVVGRLPEAFLHPGLGYVDAFVMYKTLE